MRKFPNGERSDTTQFLEISLHIIGLPEHLIIFFDSNNSLRCLCAASTIITVTELRVPICFHYFISPRRYAILTFWEFPHTIILPVEKRLCFASFGTTRC